MKENKNLEETKRIEIQIDKLTNENIKLDKKIEQLEEEKAKITEREEQLNKANELLDNSRKLKKETDNLKQELSELKTQSQALEAKLSEISNNDDNKASASSSEFEGFENSQETELDINELIEQTKEKYNKINEQVSDYETYVGNNQEKLQELSNEIKGLIGNEAYTSNSQEVNFTMAKVENIEASFYNGYQIWLNEISKQANNEEIQSLEAKQNELDPFIECEVSGDDFTPPDIPF